MIAAAEEFAVSAAGSGIAGAMPANVIKAAENAIVATHDEQRFSDEVEGEVVAGRCDLMNMADDLPGGSKERGLLDLEGLWAEIDGCRQGGGAGDVALEV